MIKPEILARHSLAWHKAVKEGETLNEWQYIARELNRPRSYYDSPFYESGDILGWVSAEMDRLGVPKPDDVCHAEMYLRCFDEIFRLKEGK